MESSDVTKMDFLKEVGPKPNCREKCTSRPETEMGFCLKQVGSSELKK